MDCIAEIGLGVGATLFIIAIALQFVGLVFFLKNFTIISPQIQARQPGGNTEGGKTPITTWLVFGMFIIVMMAIVYLFATQ